MKEYNRGTKKWEEKSEVVGSLKKRETCKAKRPHDWQLIIPDYTNSHKNDDLSQETIIKFYDFMELNAKHQKEVQKTIDEMGISYSVSGQREPTRMYRCAVCGKRDWGF